MFKILLMAMLILSSHVFASDLQGRYEGSNCYLDIDNTLSEVQAGDIICNLDIMKDSMSSLEFKGFNEIEYCKVSVKLDSERKPISFKLKTRGPFSPFYTTKAVCLDLEKI